MVYKRLFSLSITVIMDLPIKRLLGSFGAIWKNMIKPRNICVALWTKRVLFHIDNKMTVKEKKDFSFQDRFDLNENKITKYIIAFRFSYIRKTLVFHLLSTNSSAIASSAS